MEKGGEQRDSVKTDSQHYGAGIEKRRRRVIVSQAARQVIE
jgi:hypothetical protein